MAGIRDAGWQTSRAVRTATGPARVVGSSAVERCATLVRWVDAAPHGELFGMRGLDGLARRAVAESVMLALAARAGRRFGADLGENAFAGAAMAS